MVHNNNIGWYYDPNEHFAFSLFADEKDDEIVSDNGEFKIDDRSGEVERII